MILTGKEIINQVKEHNIKIKPFDEQNINPDSYDISIGRYIYCYEDSDLDALKKNKIKKIEIGKNGYTLKKNKFYFSYSAETISTNMFVPMLHSKSGIARIGLFVHITADLMNVGHNGKVLLQLYPTNDVIVYPNQKIGQVSFWMVEKE